MSSLRDRFATLDGMPVPELWADVERRAAAFGSAEPVTSAGVRVPVRSTRSNDRTLALLVAALFVVLLAGAVAVGSGLVRFPELVPAPAPASSPSSSAPSTDSPTAVPSATAVPSDAVAGPAPWIVFNRHVPSGGSRL